jgi:hypothetical protein
MDLFAKDVFHEPALREELGGEALSDLVDHCPSIWTGAVNVEARLLCCFFSRTFLRHCCFAASLRGEISGCTHLS